MRGKKKELKDKIIEGLKQVGSRIKSKVKVKGAFKIFRGESIRGKPFLPTQSWVRSQERDEPFCSKCGKKK